MSKINLLSHRLFTIFLVEPRTEYFRSFSVVPPCEAFASLFLYTVFDYRQKKPLKYSILGFCYQLTVKIYIIFYRLFAIFIRDFCELIDEFTFVFGKVFEGEGFLAVHIQFKEFEVQFFNFLQSLFIVVNRIQQCRIN